MVKRTVLAMNMIRKALRFIALTSAIAGIAMALTLLILGLTTQHAMASLPTGPGTSALTSVAAAPNGGLWVQVDGGVDNDDNRGSRTIALNGAPQYQSVPYRGSIATVPGQEGYWIVTDKGAIYPKGAAPDLCGGQLSSCSGFPSNPVPGEQIVAIAAMPDGEGFWAVGFDGKVWTAGTAVSYGDVTEECCRAIATGIAATPSGRGYYIVLNDGGVFSFGDAIFYGSTGGNKPGGHDVTGIALSYNAQGTVNGYWLVADDGGVFTFGAAPFLGSTGGNNGGSKVTSITARTNDFGYAWVHENGAVGFSDAPNMVITSVQFGTVLGPLFGGTEPGTPLGIFAANGSTSQQWQLKPVSAPVQPGSVVQLVNVRNGLCADVTGHYPTDVTIIQYPCKSSTEGRFNQLWTIGNQNGITQFVAHGVSFNHPNNYTLAGDANGNLSLVLGTATNPGWTLSNVP
jgi:hypothetical protein